MNNRPLLATLCFSLSCVSLGFLISGCNFIGIYYGLIVSVVLASWMWFIAFLFGDF